MQVRTLIRSALVQPFAVFRLLKRMYRDRFLWERNYTKLRAPKAAEGINDTSKVRDSIGRGLMDAGVTVLDYTVNEHDYRDYVKSARYDRYPAYQKGGTAPSFKEKSLEHFIAAQLLAFREQDIYIDVANDRSPTPDIYERIHGCLSYKQDIVFPRGVHGTRIGGDAAAMPVADGFADKMALHCSFEHFEGESDVGFIVETARVLKPGGRMCIIPLYLFDRYAILVDPAMLPNRPVPYPRDAQLRCVRHYGNRHGRYYDVEHFVNRIVGNLGPLRLTVYRVRNAHAVSPECFVGWAALFEKPRA